MYNIIPFILIIISLGIIIVIVARKFSVLANLDVDSIQSEREAKFKEQIISNRLKRNYLRYYTRFVQIIRPVGNFINEFFHNQYQKLLKYKDEYREQKEAEVPDENIVEKLFAEIDELLDKDDSTQAENKYIKIISLDSKSIKAFRGLGKLYFERKDFNESKQTLAHVIKLLEKDYDNYAAKENGGLIEEERAEKESVYQNLAGAYFDLSMTAKSMEAYDDAITAIDKALAIEANNPKFLDTKLEISIIKKDRKLAEETLGRLKEVNPENQKLDELEKEVMGIEN